MVSPGAAWLALAVLAAGLAGAGPAQPAVETARAWLRQYHEDPARIDRARDLLEQVVAGEGAIDAVAFTALARAWYLVGEHRAGTPEARLTAYERGREAGRRAVALAPDDAEAHLWYAVNLGSWAQAKGLLRSLLTVRELRAEVDTVLRLDPHSIEAHIMSGSLYRELPRLLGGDRDRAERHFLTARALDPHLTGVRIELALLYIEWGRDDEARRQLAGVLEETRPTDRARWLTREVPRARALLDSMRTWPSPRRRRPHRPAPLARAG